MDNEHEHERDTEQQSVDQVDTETISDEAAAKIAELTAQLEAKTAELAQLSDVSGAEIQRLKAVLYDMKNSVGSNDTDNDSDSEPDSDEIDIDDLFSE